MKSVFRLQSSVFSLHSSIFNHCNRLLFFRRRRSRLPAQLVSRLVRFVRLLRHALGLIGVGQPDPSFGIVGRQPGGAGERIDRVVVALQVHGADPDVVPGLRQVGIEFGGLAESCQSFLAAAHPAQRDPKIDLRFGILGVQLCDLIHYLHSIERPILFVDLKPENIIVAGRTLKLIDFGSAIFRDELTEQQNYFATRGYAAPELYRQKKIDERCDVYGIGMLLYYMATGLVVKNDNTGIDNIDSNGSCSKQLKSIINHLGSQEFLRIRVGVGEKPKEMDLADYVLGRFPKAQEALMEDAYKAAAEASIMVVEDGADAAMNLYNRKK